MKYPTTATLLLLLAAPSSARPVKRAAFGGQVNNGDACIAAVALAHGIQSNIDLQRGEQASLAKIKIIVSQPVVDGLGFLAAKQQLLDFVLAGVAVRSNNQLVKNDGNAAADGLAIVANAQAQELALVSSLAGNANDLVAIAQLEEDFAGGVQQNQQNAIDKRQALDQLPPEPGPGLEEGLEDSRYNKVPEPHVTGWIFGAVIISLTVVIFLILMLRKTRKENLDRREQTHEMKDWEDAYAA